LALLFTKRYRGQYTDDFDELLNPDLPIVAQMEAFAQQNKHVLPADWRVELAHALTASIERQLSPASRRGPDFRESSQWTAIFEQCADPLSIHISQ
jgi:NAD-dependent oxidoreductase involved in siderophore biosynthesis